MKYHKRLVILCITSSLLICIASMGTFKITQPKSQSILIPHPKIYISGDSSLDSFPNKTGSGTQIDPYIISNYEIDAGGVGSAVDIRLILNKYLILEGLTVSNSGNAGYDSGIKIVDCGNLVIRNNVASNNGFGISIDSSESCDLYGNTISNNLWAGMYLYDDNTLINVYENLIEENEYGIDFDAGTHCEVTGNTFNDNNGVGIEISGTSYITIESNYFTGGGTGIELIDAHQNSILKNSITQCDIGIRIESSNYNLIARNKFSECEIDYQEISSSGNTFKRYVDWMKIIIWSSIGIVTTSGITFSLIFLPKLYKKRAPQREKRKEEQKRIKIEKEQKKEEMFRKKGRVCIHCGKILPSSKLNYCIFCGKHLSKG